MIADVDGRDKPGRDGDGAFILRHLLTGNRHRTFIYKISSL